MIYTVFINPSHTVVINPSYAVAAAAGRDHHLLIRPGGSVEAYGANSFGQCNVPPGLTATVVGCGEYHSLAIRPNGSVVAWGKNSNGQCNVPLGLTAIAVDGSSTASLAIRSDGSVAQWGHLCQWYIAPGPPAGLEATDIACGYNMAAALRPDGTVIAWGGNDVSNFGSGTVKSGLTDAVSISCGYHVAALREDGSIMAWDPSGYSCEIPVEAIAVASTSSDLYALLPGGLVAYWDFTWEDMNLEPTIIPGLRATTLAVHFWNFVAIGEWAGDRRRRAAWMDLERSVYF